MAARMERMEHKKINIACSTIQNRNYLNGVTKSGPMQCYGIAWEICEKSATAGQCAQLTCTFQQINTGFQGTVAVLSKKFRCWLKSFCRIAALLSNRNRWPGTTFRSVRKTWLHRSVCPLPRCTIRVTSAHSAKYFDIPKLDKRQHSASYSKQTWAATIRSKNISVAYLCPGDGISFIQTKQFSEATQQETTWCSALSHPRGYMTGQPKHDFRPSVTNYEILTGGKNFYDFPMESIWTFLLLLTC